MGVSGKPGNCCPGDSCERSNANCSALSACVGIGPASVLVPSPAIACSNLRAISAGCNFDGKRNAKGLSTMRCMNDSTFESGFWRAFTLLTLPFVKSGVQYARQKQSVSSKHLCLQSVAHHAGV